jgi:hypothetical protein
MKDSVQHDVDERDKSFDRDIGRAELPVPMPRMPMPNITAAAYAPPF